MDMTERLWRPKTASAVWGSWSPIDLRRSSSSTVAGGTGLDELMAARMNSIGKPTKKIVRPATTPA